MGSKENLYYSWKEIGSKLALTLGELKEQKYFYDVILDCKDLDDDGPLKAHRVVLSNASPVLKHILLQQMYRGHSNPYVYFLGLKKNVLSFLLDYIYKGEVEIPQSDVESFLHLADELQIEGIFQGDPTCNDIQRISLRNLETRIDCKKLTQETDDIHNDKESYVLSIPRKKIASQGNIEYGTKLEHVNLKLNSDKNSQITGIAYDSAVNRTLDKLDTLDMLNEGMLDNEHVSLGTTNEELMSEAVDDGIYDHLDLSMTNIMKSSELKDDHSVEILSNIPCLQVKTSGISSVEDNISFNTKQLIEILEENYDC